MIKPTWIIEQNVFPEDSDAIIEAIKRAGLPYKTLEHDDIFDDSNKKSLIMHEACAVFYGSLESAKYLRKVSKWIPGIYYNIQAFNCTSYYSALGKYLLNGNYIMLPFNELRRQKEFLYEKLGQDRSIFIRPNRGDKIFTGKVVHKEHFDKDIELFMFYEPEKDELVIVSEPRNLVFEWRFVCVDGQIITGSQYRENERVAQDEYYPPEAIDLAKEVAVNYNPDRAWVIDICKTKVGDYKLMEIGCFSCCGLYKCNRDIIVKAVSEAALKEWKDYQPEGDK